MLREALRKNVEAMREHAPKVYAHGDPEELHELRVAVRRLRALLRAGRSAIDDSRTEALRSELGTLGRALGPARDADVFAQYIARETDGLLEGGTETLLEQIEAERLAAYADARETLDSPALQRLLHDLDDFAATATIADGALDGVVRGELKKLRRAMRDVTGDEELHRARIKAKRVRYAAEAAGDEATAKRAKRLQDVIGEHHDAVFAEARLRGLAGAETALLAGRLIERQAQRRRRARKATPAAWKRLIKAR